MTSSHVLAYATAPGIGGLGHHVDHVLTALAPAIPDLLVYGPAPASTSPSALVQPPAVLVASWRRRYTWLRYLTGRYQYISNRHYGRWLVSKLASTPFRKGYFFTQIAHESLELARRLDAFTILDNPNGHIRDFREQLCVESQRWTGSEYLGHPTEAMVDRVEDEYRLADRIRVSSTWAKRSLAARGVDQDKIFIVPQPIDVRRFTPRHHSVRTGPLRLVFVGSFSLGKGFPYLLRAMSRLGGRHFSLTMIGATGDPWCHRLLTRLTAGLDVTHAPGDPTEAYHAGDVFVLPSLHDGFGLVVAEAMACGLPVITTDACGASEWVDHDVSGWVLPRGDEDRLVAALETALTHRGRLPEMGRVARRAVERLAAGTITQRLRDRVRECWDAPLHGAQA